MSVSSFKYSHTFSHYCLLPSAGENRDLLLGGRPLACSWCASGCSHGQRTSLCDLARCCLELWTRTISLGCSGALHPAEIVPWALFCIHTGERAMGIFWISNGQESPRQISLIIITVLYMCCLWCGSPTPLQVIGVQ